jgi:hypothetical protein
MAMLHVAGTLSASESTQTLTEQHLTLDDKRFLLPSPGCLSPTGSDFSASAVTLADDTAQDDTFTVRDHTKYRLGTPGTNGEKQVTWDGPDDPENPKNWSVWQKWTVSLGSLLWLTICSPLPTVF